MTASLQFDPGKEFDTAIRLARSGNTLAGLKHARAAYKMVVDNGDEAMRRRALNTVAICQGAHGQFIEAVADAIDAYTLSQTAGDTLEATHALATLAGAASFILDTLDTSMLMLDKCLSQALALGDIPLEVRVRNIRGILLGTLKRFDEAEHEFAVALSLVDRAGENTRPAMLVGNVAALSVKRARAADDAERERFTQTALARIQETLDISAEEGNADVESRGYYNLGDIRAQQGRVQDALDAFAQSMKFAKQVGQRARVIDAHVERGKLFAARRDWQSARAEFQAAFDVADAHRPTGQIATAAEQLSAACEQLGDAKAALGWIARAGVERELFERESEQARRQLDTFWRGFNAGS
jgi:tetratricopeptide (TPR) repeat protein